MARIAPLSKPETGITLVPKNKPIKVKRDSQTAGVISSISKMLKGGKKEFMEIAKFAPDIDPNCACILEEWENLSSTGRKSVSMDQICKAKGIDPFHFLGVVAEAAIKFRDNASVILAAMQMPAVVQKSIKTALTKDGVRDRKMLFEHAHFIPTPGGATFVNQFAAKVEQNAGVEPGRLPSFESSMKTLEIEAD